MIAFPQGPDATVEGRVCHTHLDDHPGTMPIPVRPRQRQGEHRTWPPARAAESGRRRARRQSGSLKSCPDPQLGQFPGGVGSESEGLDLQFSQCVSRLITAAGPDGSAKHFGESDCAGCELIIAIIQEDVRRPSVVGCPHSPGAR